MLDVGVRAMSVVRPLNPLYQQKNTEVRSQGRRFMHSTYLAHPTLSVFATSAFDGFLLWLKKNMTMDVWPPNHLPNLHGLH